MNHFLLLSQKLLITDASASHYCCAVLSVYLDSFMVDGSVVGDVDTLGRHKQKGEAFSIPPDHAIEPAQTMTSMGQSSGNGRTRNSSIMVFHSEKGL